MLLVAGTIGIDHIITPHGEKENCIGGSAVHFAYASSLLTPTRICGIVGQDFPQAALKALEDRRVDTAGVQTAPGKTFRWSGRYHEDMDNRDTLYTELNVLADWQPQVPAPWLDSDFVFLANGAPSVQLALLDQLPNATLTVCDTMDLWINTAREELDRVFKAINGIIINDSEASSYTGEKNIIQAGHKLLELGPAFVIIKKGGHGSVLFTQNAVTALPAYPVPAVFDPTGAGDSFAGGFMGYLASCGRPTEDDYKTAVAHATCIASFNVADFGIDRLAGLARAELDQRLQSYRRMLSIEIPE